MKKKPALKWVRKNKHSRIWTAKLENDEFTMVQTDDEFYVVINGDEYYFSPGILEEPLVVAEQELMKWFEGKAILLRHKADVLRLNPAKKRPFMPWRKEQGWPHWSLLNANRRVLVRVHGVDPFRIFIFEIGVTDKIVLNRELTANKFRDALAEAERIMLEYLRNQKTAIEADIRAFSGDNQ